jgi:signal transduction histidine kinase
VARSGAGAPHRVRNYLVDAAFVGVSTIDGLFDADPPITAAAILVSCVALIARRRWPYPVFVLTLPAAWLVSAEYASLIALYTVAARERNRRLVVCCALAFIICNVTPSPWAGDAFAASGGDLLAFAAFSTAMAAAPALLGQFQLARQDLADRLQEIIAAREQEDRLLAQTVLAVERAQLAREMHDVVSHQVSLIAVHAGALQSCTDHPLTREAAETIRQLSVKTLDELRHMVTVLRASGSTPTEITPQPTLGDLPGLVATSGLPARLSGALPDDVPSPQQRAIYRTVQEALTNIRKHAPGATAAIHLDHDQTGLAVTISNTPPTQSPMHLPSAGHGLVGLRERAQLLGGTLATGGTPDHGYQVQLWLPARQSGADNGHGIADALRDPR